MRRRRPSAEAAELAAHVDRLWTVPWSRRSLDPRNLTTALATVRRILRTGRYDVLHTHTPVASLVARLAAASLPAGARPAVVYTAHGFHFGAAEREGPAEWLFARSERLAGRWTDRLIVINGDDLATARRLELVAPERLRLLPGIGVDLDWYRPTPAVRAEAGQRRAALGLADDDMLFAMVAYFDPGKNHRLVLRALRQIDRADLHVAFAGKGPLEAELRAEAERLGVAERVHFLGAVDDVRPLIAASVATLLPSFREGLSRAVLESLAMGVPVLGSRVRGIAELVEPGGGVLVDPHDAGALAAAMEKTAEDPAACFDGPAVRRPAGALRHRAPAGRPRRPVQRAARAASERKEPRPVTSYSDDGDDVRDIARALRRRKLLLIGIPIVFMAIAYRRRQDPGPRVLGVGAGVGGAAGRRRSTASPRRAWRATGSCAASGTSWRATPCGRR